MKNLFFLFLLSFVFFGCITDSAFTGQGLAPTRNLAPSAQPDSTLENYLVPALEPVNPPQEPETEQTVSEEENVLTGEFEEPFRISIDDLIAETGYVPDQTGGESEPIRKPSTPPRHLWNAYALEGVSNSTFTMPKVADLDGDGTKEIVSALMSADNTGYCHEVIKQGIYTWDEQGQLLEGFPVYLETLNYPDNCGGLSIVGIADVIGSNKLEIVVATGNGSMPRGGVYVISNTGRVISKIATNVHFSGGDIWHPILVNLDEDEKKEIVAIRPQRPLQINGKIYAWNGDGTTLDGWPVSFLGEDYVYDGAADDVDGDGQIELFFPSSFRIDDAHFGARLRSYQPNGTLNWVVDLPFGGVSPGKIILADVDQDGSKELIITVFRQREPNEHSEKLIAIINSADGSLKNFWPNLNGYSYYGNLAVGNMDSDKELEILYTDVYNIYVADANDGTQLPGFPRHLWDDGSSDPPNWDIPAKDCVGRPPYCYATSIGVADLIGDTKQEIFTFAYSYLPSNRREPESYFMSFFAFDSSGHTLPGFPFHLKNYVYVPDNVGYSWGEIAPPTFTNLGNDGLSDIVTSKGFGRIEAFTINNTYNESLAIVPEFGVDRQNTRTVKQN
ncbi:MAG: hypothetical protein HY392_02945 [Candidatus Diapherotrites archaeon]|nr:hypothetical protein [Candidatus Diapherotrites archaeon]